MKKALVTGINGFAGSYLAELLLKIGYEVHGVIKTETSNLDSIKNKLHLYSFDLLDASKTAEIVANVRPDLVFHLAALTSPAQSFKDPASFFTTNISAEINIFNAIVEDNLLNTRILITSSAEVYGMVKAADLPIDEDTPLRPGSPYAVSKIAQDYLGLQYFLSNKLQVIRVRPFNHIGPRQSPEFVVASFAKQIADIEKGKTEPVIKVGNLEAKRDFTNVQDMVKAYELIINKGEAGEVYNIGSGVSHRIKDVLDKLLAMSQKQAIVREDPSKLRPSDIPDIISDSSKLESLTGWKPEIPFDQTLKDTLEYFRNTE